MARSLFRRQRPTFVDGQSAKNIWLVRPAPISADKMCALFAVSCPLIQKQLLFYAHFFFFRFSSSNHHTKIHVDRVVLCFNYPPYFYQLSRTSSYESHDQSIEPRHSPVMNVIKVGGLSPRSSVRATVEGERGGSAVHSDPMEKSFELDTL